MNKTKLALALMSITIVIIGVLFVVFSNTKTNTETPIKVGGLFALTGKLASVGTTESRFTQIAIDEINSQGGIDGKQIQFILEDDKCSGTDAINGANKLIFQDNIKFILGPGCTPASVPVAPVANENKVFMIAATTTAKDVFDNYEYAFRTSPESTDAAILIAKLAKNRYKLNKVAIIIEQTEFAQSWADDFKKSFEDKGGEIIYTESYVSGNTDFRTVLSKIPKDADGVFVSSQSPLGAGNIVKQMNELGLLDGDNKLQIIGPPTLIDTESYKASGESLPEDAFTVTPYANNEELLNKYKSKYGEEPGFTFFYTASMYDMVYLLKEALEYCGEDSTCVKDYFQNQIEGREGEVATWSFDINGDPILPEENYNELNIVGGNKSFSSIEE